MMMQDVHNYKRRLEKFLENIKNNGKITQKNKELIVKFHEFCFIEGLNVSRIVRYLYDLIKQDKRGYITIMKCNNLVDLINESNLTGHIIFLIFIIDLLQSKSPEITRTHLNYSPLKRVFETSNILCLNILSELLNYKNIELNKLEEVKNEYENIAPEIKDYSCEDILKKINDLILEVNKYDYKGYSLLKY